MARDDIQTADDDPALLRLKSQIKEKDAALAQEREGRVRAETAAVELHRRVTASGNARVEADRTACANAIAAAETELEALENAAASAMSEQKWAEVAKINTQIADATQRRAAAQTQLGRIDNWVKNQTARAVEAERRRAEGGPQPGGPQPGGPQPGNWEQNLAFIIQNLQPADQEFLNRPDGAAANLAKTERGWTRITAYHDEALEAGIPHRSQAYYDYIESRAGGRSASATGRREPESHDGATVVDIGRREGERQVSRIQPQPSALPPSRGAGAGGSSRRSNEDEVSLSQSEVEQAHRSFGPDKTNPATGKPFTEEEGLVAYATQKKRLIQEGRL